MSFFSLSVAAHVVIELYFIGRVMLRPNREPASRLAWLVVIVTLPVGGILLYALLGEARMGARRVRRIEAVAKQIAAIPRPSSRWPAPEISAQFAPLFQLGKSISGLGPVSGNRARLLGDSNSAIDELVRDIDAAKHHVHLLFYIWLQDRNGTKILEAVKRAAARKVTCRVMADGLGSRPLIRSADWRALKSAGVHAAVALPIGSFVLRAVQGRIDLRNHRKIAVIDNHITYCGSQNCADPEFRPKAKFAPWVDIMVRFEGPIARQNQRLFIEDWMTHTDENLQALLEAPLEAPVGGFPAQVIGTGPTVRFSAMPEMFEALIDSARRELVITTPYYVPNESLQTAICSAAYRGVDTQIVFPERNDSWVVGGASRSNYDGLLRAGVKVFEYRGGLLHSKTLTVDGEVSLIGSANMDRRSFDLNYENGILFVDSPLTADIRARQSEYIAQSRQVSRAEVEAWGVATRLRNNTLAVMSPVL